MAERSCFTCDHARDDDGSRNPGRCTLLLTDDASDDVIVDYADSAGLDDDGRPIDRTVDCPLWAAPKEER